MCNASKYILAWHTDENYRMSILLFDRLSNVLLLTERASYLLSSSYTIINDPIEVTTRTLASESHGETVKYPWYKLKFDICELCNGKFLEGSLRRYLHDRHNKLNQTGHQEKFPAADLSLPNNILDHLKAQDITIDEYYNRHVKLSLTNIAFIQTPQPLLSELKYQPNVVLQGALWHNKYKWTCLLCNKIFCQGLWRDINEKPFPKKDDYSAIR